MKDLSIIPGKQPDTRLQNAVDTVDYFIRRDYLAELSNCDVVELPDEDSKLLRFFHLEKLIYDKAENINDKLVSIYSAIQNVDASAILLIRGKASGVSFYVGVHARESAYICGSILGSSLLANFPGSALPSYDGTIIHDIFPLERILQ